MCVFRISILKPRFILFFFFFFNDTATTEIYTLSLHDALPIYDLRRRPGGAFAAGRGRVLQRLLAPRRRPSRLDRAGQPRSEEHTSELQSRLHLVCRLLLEKKKKIIISLNNESRTLILVLQLTQ